MTAKESASPKYLTNTTLWFMTIGAGLVVSNNYYCQPLLGMISRELNVSESAVSRISMLTQIGYAIGLLLVVPLGDMFKRKKIILGSFCLNIMMLLLFGFGQNLNMLLISSFLIGLTSVVPQMFVPIAAQVSNPKDKDRNIAIVMSGLLIGIIGSRIISGWIGKILGWREMYYIAAGVIFGLGIFLFFLLPDIKPTFKGTYKKLMSSIFNYARTIPSLQLACLRGGFALGSFSAFWTILTFHLEQAPFFAGSDMAGSLSIFGVAGALSASLVGKLSGKLNKIHLITFAISLMVVAWIIFGVAGYTYAGLIIGIVLIDMGLQSTHVSNQTIVFSTHPEASNRLNAVYMTSYFIGGSLGTYFGGLAWGKYGWYGVVVAGLAFAMLGLLVHLIWGGKKKYQIGN